LLCQHGWQASNHGQPDRQADAELEQKSVNLIDDLHAIVHEGFTDPMQGRKCLL
jgi:hypothetical protein